MPSGGWVKVYRQILRSEIWAHDGLLKLFILCLLKATHAERTVLVDRRAEPVTLKPGQFVTGRYALHQEYYPAKREQQKSPSTLWRWLQTLETLGNVNIKTNSRFSIVTICNWTAYQNGDSGNEQQDEQQVNSRRTAGEQQTRTDKKVKKGKKVKKTTGFDPLTVPIPEHLDTPDFRTAWTEWVGYRRTVRHKPMSEKATNRQLALLGRYAVNDAISIMDKSITNDWTGLFTPTGKDKGKHDPTAERPDYSKF